MDTDYYFYHTNNVLNRWKDQVVTITINDTGYVGTLRQWDADNYVLETGEGDLVIINRRATDMIMYGDVVGEK